MSEIWCQLQGTYVSGHLINLFGPGMENVKLVIVNTDGSPLLPEFWKEPEEKDGFHSFQWMEN